jgi:hypothetical protein|tara:strand:+ start:370 stop:1296 length:927 start_codon:yes stop_codon:yes gene_type:complete
MASTYTSNIRLTKQGDGDNPNTWGQVLNNGVISLIDDAVAGYTTVSLGSAATVTLTNNQGAGDQSRSAILEFKGSVGGAYNDIVVLIPNNSKSYIVKNSVSYNDSSDTVVLKVAGNTGVTLSGGATGFYITNGTTVLPVAQTNFSNITATGTLAVQGATSLSGAVNIVGNAVIGGTLSVGGAAYFGSTVTVSGKGKFTVGAFTPIVTLTDATSVAVDLNTGNVFIVTLAGNRTLAAPTNTTTNIGQTGQIVVQQDSTGGRTLSFNTVYQFPGGTISALTSTTSGVDIVFYAVRTTTKVDSILIRNFTR